MSCRQCELYERMGFGQQCPCLHHFTLRGKLLQFRRACGSRARLWYFLSCLFHEVFNV